MTKYYLHDGIQEQGPFDLEQLRLKNVKKETKVWHEGLDNWTTVGELIELKDLIIRKTPPPINNSKEDLKPPKLEDVSNPQTLPLPVIEKKKSKLIPIIIISFLLIGGIIGWIIYENVQNGETIETLVEKVTTQDETISTQSATISSQGDELSLQNEAEEEKRRINSAITQKNMKYRNNWYDYIDVSRNAFTYSEIGGITNLLVKVRNRTDYMLDQVVVSVDYVKSNGGNYKTENVIIYNIPANSTKSASAPESNRGTSVNLDIIEIISKKMHFCYPYSNGNSEDPYFCK